VPDGRGHPRLARRVPHRRPPRKRRGLSHGDNTGHRLLHPAAAPARARERQSTHEGFLVHKNGKWIKISAGLALALIRALHLRAAATAPLRLELAGLYARHRSGALLILWLTALGMRKRAITPGRWSLKAWTSAHVWLGVLLIVIGTLHSGFAFGWNVHTLAWALMMIVIISGIFGVTAYATLPRALFGQPL
jgi:hypothetical protein